AQRGVDTVGPVLGEVGAARAPIVEAREVGLQLRLSSEGRDPAAASAPFAIGRGLVDRAARFPRDRHEAVASFQTPGHAQNAAAERRADARAALERIPAAACDLAGDSRVGAA